jgi:translation initiation factor IF-2
MSLKVYELAEEYNINSKALLNHLRELGIFVSSHMSLLDDDEVAKVRATISHVEKRQEVMEQRIRPTVIRRRVVRPLPEELPAEEVSRLPEPLEVTAEAQESQLEASASDEAAAMAEPEAKQAVVPEPPAKPKKVKPEEAAVVIDKPAVPSEPLSAESEASALESAEQKEAADIQAMESSLEVPADVEEKKDRESPMTSRAKKVKAPGEFPEPAKIVERPRPELVRRLEARERPAEPPAEAPAAPPTETEPQKKAKPRKRKALKAFEVIHQERPLRGRAGKKKEVIQLRDDFQERERVFRVGPKKKKVREPQKTEVTVPKAIKRKIRVADSISVGELAKRMGVKAGDLIKKLIGLGVMATVNQFLDPDEAALVGAEFGYEVERVVTRAEAILEEVEIPEAEENLRPRPPVVTVMGHVDHGKTSLLDSIRKTDVIHQEFGGITQHIGAYQIEINNQLITFLDTPGHEAFTSLRARGAQVTDIVVLVVAADDGVMNQTKEALDHARAAGVPIVVAINKIDKPNADAERVRQELANLGLAPEEWGGDTIFCEVSAKQSTGIDMLLEYILLQAEILELKANPDKLARGIVIEAKLDRQRGPVVTVLVQEGTLNPNDFFVAGAYAGKIRMMFDHRGRRVVEAAPSAPVEVVGSSGVPLAGEKLLAMAEEKEARDIETFRQEQLRKEEIAHGGRVSLDNLMEQLDAEGLQELPVLIKGDVQGSIETLRETLTRMGGEKIKINVIHASVGGITENDINLSSASNAIIIGFNVRPEPRAQSLADELNVDMRLYRVIYELIEDVEKAMVGMLEPTKKENLLGRGELVQLFKVSRVGTVAGTLVKEGRISKDAHARLIREGVVVHEGKIESLRRYQEDVQEVPEGQDCGILLENFNDVKVGDMVESYTLEEIAPEL